jgi:hypothetical protein
VKEEDDEEKRKKEVCKGGSRDSRDVCGDVLESR